MQKGLRYLFLCGYASPISDLHQSDAHKHFTMHVIPVNSIYWPCVCDNSTTSHKLFPELLRRVRKGQCFASNVIDWCGTTGRQDKIIVKHQFPWLFFVFEVDFNWKEKASITSLSNRIGRIL